MNDKNIIKYKTKPTSSFENKPTVKNINNENLNKKCF